MTLTGSSASFDDAVPSVSVDTIYDLRGDDERSASTYINGGTILSSAASSAPTESLDDGTNRGVTVPNESFLSLSFNPSMVNSSVLIASNTDANGNWIDIDGADLPQLSIASDASTASGSTSCSPEVFVNIGRSMMHASQSTSTTGSETASDKMDKLSTSSGVVDSGKEMFARLQTDEDWDNFRLKAKDYLNALVTEEMKGLKHNDEGSNCTDHSVDKTGSMQQSSQGIWQWMHAIYVSINATISGIGPKEDSTKSHYYSSLVKEIVEIEEQLRKLPPMPPSLPLGGLPLDDLPAESRKALEDYHVRLNAWKGEIMPRHEELTAQYIMCQERLLAAIIDSEEEMFYDKFGDSLGVVNNDGYVEVVEKRSPQWDDVNETLAVSQSKCNLTTLGAALFAVLTAGAGIVLKLQSRGR